MGIVTTHKEIGSSTLFICDLMLQQSRVTSEYGLLCRNGSVVDITAEAADDCYWAARPWNTFVTHGGARWVFVHYCKTTVLEFDHQGIEGHSDNCYY